MFRWWWNLRVNVVGRWYGLPWGIVTWDPDGADAAYEEGQTPKQYFHEGWLCDY